MELIICFGLAVSVFSLVIALIVGLISAPTPILLGILIVGMMFTQKSIDKLTTNADINLVEEKDKDTIEKVEVKNNQGNGLFKGMIYRGLNYNSSHQIALNIPKKNIQYRGVKTDNKPSDTV
ncbi:hypothetical protein IQ215_06305 [Cyanobacterium stanieri LEGE 03274]|uniref:Uncharacterized protein n=1 Tax=Cyanobacterium stanieri LEGE 03274 TaxID=1828756 RepID=A0ABR9V338_9CHRO|nr:hypothetical protein [Cyanobacterium stanieri]MBE9222305.1 hypothetical protein [Cyanobacterium stanieri LEGE 03274]